MTGHIVNFSGTISNKHDNPGAGAVVCNLYTAIIIFTLLSSEGIVKLASTKASLTEITIY